MGRERKIFQGKLITVLMRRQTLPNGYKARLEVIKHVGAALVVPFLSKNRVIMIRQYRPVIQKYIYEFPAGTLSPEESPCECAKREIIEETGYSAGNMKKTGYIYPAPGYTTEKIIIYKAWGMKKGRYIPEDDEIIKVCVFTLAQVKAMIRKGKMVDAKSIAALAICGSL